MLPALIVSEAVGYSTAPNPFDDLVKIGLWPAYEYIAKVLKVTIWVGANQINCIETTYRMSNSTDNQVARHGTANGTQHTVDLSTTEDKFFVGIFGSQDNNADQPTLRRLGFLVYDRSDGSLTPNGAWPATAATGVKGFTSLGLITGFSGTTATNDRLDTLAIYKLQSGSDTFGISNV